MKKGIITTVSFLLFIAVFSLGTFLTPSREFSENENRPLASFPNINAESVSSGKAQSELNTYVSDQLVFRDFLVSLKSSVEKAAGMRESGGVYFAQDGYYIKKLSEQSVDDNVFLKNLNAVNTFFENNKKLGKSHITFLLSPTAGGILGDKLPAGTDYFDQKSRIETAQNSIKNGTFVELYDDFLKTDESIYYKTDHHWTTRGAYLAYVNYCKALNKEPKKYKSEVFSEDFRGTLYSKAPYFGAEYDTVELFKLQNEDDLTLFIDGDKADFPIYDLSKADAKDKYTVFFGGNYPQMRIESKSGKGNLLVIKDSYANSFLPFIAEDFGSITVVDPRYCQTPISQIVKDNEITDILLLYNIESFVSDEYIPLITL